MWATAKQVAEIFDTTKQNISSHIQNIYNEAELSQISTVKKILTVQVEGNREVNREYSIKKILFFKCQYVLSI